MAVAAMLPPPYEELQYEEPPAYEKRKKRKWKMGLKLMAMILFGVFMIFILV